MKVIEVPLTDEVHRALVEAAHEELRQPGLEARRILERALRRRQLRAKQVEASAR